MAIPHAQAGNVISVRPLGTALGSTRTHALFKSTDLEVIRMVVPAGSEIPPHAVAGDITVQCIEGRIALCCAEGLRELAAGELIQVSGQDMHSLRGLEDASLLLTIALKNPGPSL